MLTSIVVFYTRRPDLSPDEFKDYMERVHVPIIKNLMGDVYPTYRRRYPQRVESGAGDRLGLPAACKQTAKPHSPIVLVGSPDDLGWDMMGEMVFRDELHLQQGLAIMNSDDGQKIKDDEENFTVPHKLTVALLGGSISS